jgi:CPA1 family monovalent cation:H+ antiporter
MSSPGLNIAPYFWLLLLTFVVAIPARRTNVPYALALVIAGLVVGAPGLLPQVHLEPRTLFSVFLPPLLFESALNLPAGPLRRDWKPIGLFALFGTLLSAFIIGGVASLALQIPIAYTLVFGALISATDPISVLAVFKRLRAHRRLRLIVEAESLFNDGVAVVLFSVTLGAALGGGLSFWGSLGEFLRMAAGGVALGAAFGWLATRVHSGLDDTLVEITLTTVVAFGSYLCAEMLHVSGVIAVVSAGLVVGNVARETAMTPGTRLEVDGFWEYAAFVVNSIVFLLIGIEAAFVHWWAHWEQVLGALLAVFAGRAAIYPLSWIVNGLGGEVRPAWQHILFWGGLRGALSMALVLGLPRDFPFHDILVAATFGVALFSLLAQGLTVGPLLRRLGLTEPPAGDREYQRLASEELSCHTALAELDRLHDTEAYPPWALRSLRGQYRQRLADLKETMAAMRDGDDGAAREQYAVVRRMALLAEKSAFSEAERRGWLDEGESRRLSDRIAAELLAIEGHGGE